MISVEGMQTKIYLKKCAKTAKRKLLGASAEGKGGHRC